MSLVLARCTPSDAPELAKVHLETNQAGHRQQVIFQNVPRSALLSMYEQSFFEGITAQENHTFSHERHYIKITDTAANEIISYAIWEELSDGYKPEEDFQAVFHPLPEGANEEMARDFCAMTARFRGEGERSKEGHWLLSLLGTHPEHQRRGAAAQLVRWAFPLADKEAKNCYVDASVMGYPLYRKCGFEDVGDIIWDLGKYEAGEGRGTIRWVAMKREPGKR